MVFTQSDGLVADTITATHWTLHILSSTKSKLTFDVYNIMQYASVDEENIKFKITLDIEIRHYYLYLT